MVRIVAAGFLIATLRFMSAAGRAEAAVAPDGHAVAITAAAATPATDPSPVWLFLGDQSPGPTTGLLPTPRALARREKARREREALGRPASASDPASSDREPTAHELDAIRAAGGRVRAVSRWLNAVSVDADPVSLAAIRALPFVREARPVATLEADAGAADPPAGAAGAVPGAAEPGDVAEAGPSYPQLAPIGILEAHALGYHGEGVVIGVLDSGFTLRHETFRDIDVRGQRDFVQGDDDPSDDRSRLPRDPPGSHNHGTQVLSLIAANSPGTMIGAAPRAAFVLAKTEQSGSETAIEEDFWCAGLEWAEAMGADVITTSLSYTGWYRASDFDGRSAITTRMANLAWERGVVILNSAGNQGPKPSTLGAPADAPGTLTVGATSLAGRIVGFSSRGPTGDGRIKPDVVAPGSGVLVASAGSLDRYHRGSGTSYSTPLVAGLAALVIEAHPDWGPEAVREAIVMSADRADRPANDYGWGIPNARDAIFYPFLEGRVTDRAGGAPVAGARVRWERVEGPRGEWAAPGDSPAAGETRTDAAGSYTIPNLPPGVYRLAIEAPGFTPQDLGPFDVPPNLGGVDAALEPAR
ncbi:MAG TPA: S8 family serine peptidase [Candidatus Eisenbacteria bacterium]|nr:S8 family serine peptidase [Candidatus Eisenbacteria bacterium]